MHQRARLAQINRLTQNGQIVRGHHRGHGRRIIVGKAHIAVRHDTQKLTTLAHHRKAGDAVAFLQRLSVRKRLVGGQRVWLIDDPGDKAFYPADFTGLTIDVKITVHNAHTARLSHRNRHAPFGHCVHRRAEQRDVQANGLRNPRARVSGARQDARSAWNKQYIIKGESLTNLHSSLLGRTIGWHLPISRKTEEGKAQSAVFAPLFRIDATFGT